MHRRVRVNCQCARNAKKIKDGKILSRAGRIRKKIVKNAVNRV